MTRFLSFLLLTLLAAPVLRAADADVYSGEVPVVSQDREERVRALPGALRNALSRYSGLRDFEEIEGFEEALESASGMLVTFYYRGIERPMADGSWSFVGGGPRFPQTTGRPSYDGKRTTITLPVKLKPGWSYEFWLNRGRFDSFRSRKGVPLAPVHVRFRTREQ